MKNNGASTEKMETQKAESCREIAGSAVAGLRNSPTHQAIVNSSQLSHREIEELFAVHEGRRQVLLAAAAHIFESLPQVVAQLTAQAIKGNPAACKLVLEIAGLKQSIEETVAARAEDTEPDDGLEASFFQDIQQRIAAMPAGPEPPLK